MAKIIRSNDEINRMINDGDLSTNYGFKNYIINPGFDVWQRGTSVTSVDNSNLYLADRWYSGLPGVGTLNFNKYSEDVIEGQNVNALSIYLVSTSSQYVDIAHRIENMMQFAGKTVTLSFWMVSDEVGKDITVYFGRHYSSVATNYSNLIVAGTTVSGITKYTVTYTFPDYAGEAIDSTSYMEILIRPFVSTSGKTVRIAQVQLEEGSVATPFENLSYALQYEQCRRYYRRYATQQNLTDLSYQMRITPTESGTAPYTYDAEL